MTRSDAELVHDALDHLAMLHRHLGRADLNDQTVADAVSLRFASAIEAISETSDEFRDRVLGNDWKFIWATRNRIAHGYAYIDMRLIEDTIDQDLPDFERSRSLLSERVTSHDTWSAPDVSHVCLSWCTWRRASSW